MAIKKFRPVTSTQRYKTVRDTSHLARKDKKNDKRPAVPSALFAKLNYKAGRNNAGRISSRHRGGRHKRRYRIIDFKRDKDGVPADVVSLHYDPNRSADLALLKYDDGDYRFILAAEGLEPGHEVVAGKKTPIWPGNSLLLKHIPPGSLIHNIELQAGRGAQIARAAGSYATLAGEDGAYVILKMPSGETRKVHKHCRATIGQVGNKEHNLIRLGKAGRKRWLGKRPHTRGVAMNPVDHPLGGGEGKSAGGRHPCTPWGKPSKGYKTRKKNKPSDVFIVQKAKNRRRR